ncbi:hypothetical protein [Leptotrichia trevisanii]|nr:hypothetical protein [Leptotrichia trevisanii]
MANLWKNIINKIVNIIINMLCGKVESVWIICGKVLKMSIVNFCG